MKRWAFITVGLYLLALLALTAPVFAAAYHWGAKSIFGWDDIFHVFQEAPYWIWIGVSVAAQVLLLVVPVAKAAGRPVKRRHVLTPILTSAFLLGFMCVAFVAMIAVVIWKDDGLKMFEVFGNSGFHPWGALASYVAVAWIGWALAFWQFQKRDEPTAQSAKLLRWLLAGSILELLVAVPSHVIVRNRADCCAPLATFWGIATGITVMLMAFGPGVFFLFVKRAQQLRPRSESHV
jgi:hypothetical protein